MEALKKSWVGTQKAASIFQWSFGVFLWELMTKAQQPFGDIDPFEMESYLNEGYRLHQPLNCPDQLYSGENYFRSSIPEVILIWWTEFSVPLYVQLFQGISNALIELISITVLAACWATLPHERATVQSIHTTLVWMQKQLQQFVWKLLAPK